MILFRDAVAMVDQSPELGKRLTKKAAPVSGAGTSPTWPRARFPAYQCDDGQSGRARTSA